MEKISFPTLAEAILGAPGNCLPSKLDAEQALDHLRPILDFLIHHLHPFRISRVPPDFLEETVFQKYGKARAEHRAFVHAKLAERTNICEEELSHLEGYGRLLEASEVMVDGMACGSARAVLHRVKSNPSLCRLLVPPRLYHIHGDMFFKNILINPERAEGASFTLIDPKPRVGGGDRAKDFANLLLSCQGGFTLFSHDYFDVDIDEDKGRLRVAINLWGAEPKVTLRKFADGKTSGGVFEEVQVLDGTELAVLQDVGQNLPGLIHGVLSGGREEKDDRWLMRAELNQAVSLCSLILPHLQESPKRALACHAMGLKLLNEFWEKYG